MILHIWIIMAMALICQSKSDPIDMYGHFLLDVKDPGLYEVICGNKDNEKITKYKINCFIVAPAPVNEWAYDVTDKTLIWAKPTPNMKQTHILDYRIMMKPRTKRSKVYLHRELTLPITLQIFPDNSDLVETLANLQQSKNAEITPIRNKKIEKSTTKAKSVQANFLHLMNKENTPTEIKRITSDAELRTNCFFIKETLCQNSKVYPHYIQELYKDATQLINIYDGPLLRSRKRDLDAGNNKAHFFLDLPTDYIIQLAVDYAYIAMKSYTYEAKKQIESMLRKRECFLVNEVNDLLIDVTNLNANLELLIRQFIVIIMNGFFNLARIVHRNLGKIVESINNKSIDDMWTKIGTWEKYMKQFTDDCKVRLMEMYQSTRYTALKQASEQYYKTLLSSQRMDRANTERDLHPRWRRQLVEVLTVENNCANHCKYGTTGTRDWFRLKEQVYQSF
ncbi:uncharacterized protein BBOV_IV011940 [Babesia bovis T2Bo]|uniref:Uncharacterized protein n=1 Tax=Babesia bovis TaxID=5865 RepID=A7ASM7_BABBO|nr:uncharacterized protein BBOV_IV011940 [Babesia bovis T2Bo]EDO07546.1 hypothetical protein BBOV_IV011940 [Babesia bovis T2Bo]|eukprot:XP_001611114.1 hypothetical protein [Babesia bovis T2Bo]